MLSCCGARTKPRRVFAFKETKPGEFKAHYTDTEYSLPTFNEVSIIVKACSISSIDADMATIHPSSYTKLKRHGFVLGRDFAGIVKDVGPKVTKFQKGDKVYGLVKSDSEGTWAETIVLEEKYIAKMPDNITFEEAATIPYSALTAYKLLYTTLNIQAGAKILIHDAAVDEGYFAVQLAHLRGLHVYASTNQVSLAEELKKLGADEVGEYYKGDVKLSLKYAVDFSYEKELDVNLHKMISKENVLAFSDKTKYEKILKDGTFPSLPFSVSADGEDLEKISELVKNGNLKIAIRDRVKFYTQEQPFRENEIRGLGKRIIAMEASNGKIEGESLKLVSANAKEVR